MLMKPNGLDPHFIAEERTEKLRALFKVTQLGSGRSETRSRLPPPNSLFYSILVMFIMKHHLTPVEGKKSLES